MRLNYTLTLGDFKAYHRLYGSRTRRNKTSYSFYFAVMPVVAALGFVPIVVFILLGWTDWLKLCAPGEAVFLGVALFSGVKRFYNIRKNFNRFTKYYLPLLEGQAPFLEIDDKGILFAFPGYCEGKYLWNSITDFAENERLTLLYLFGKKCLVIPTCALSPEKRLELGATVRRNVVRRKS